MRDFLFDFWEWVVDHPWLAILMLACIMGLVEECSYVQIVDGPFGPELHIPTED